MAYKEQGDFFSKIRVPLIFPLMLAPLSFVWARQLANEIL